MTVLTTSIISEIIAHWFYTPANGYYGYDYGRNLHELLLKPLSVDGADQLLAWLKADIPLFATLSDDQLSIVSETVGFDTQKYYIQVGSIVVPIPNLQEINRRTGDTFNANAG